MAMTINFYEKIPDLAKIFPCLSRLILNYGLAHSCSYPTLMVFTGFTFISQTICKTRWPMQIKRVK